MAAKRRVEIFSADCEICADTVALVRRLACDSCDVVVLSMGDPEVSARARHLGVRSLPAVVVGGRLAACCAERGPDEAALRAVGVGQALG